MRDAIKFGNFLLCLIVMLDYPTFGNVLGVIQMEMLFKG